jgi:hypothetical protein
LDRGQAALEAALEAARIAMAKRDEDRCGENDTALLDCLIVLLWFTLPVNANRN